MLARAARRIARAYEEESALTLAELRRRPCGKATEGSRSLLHDDMSVVIIDLVSMSSRAMPHR